jgi:hypothetical protein
MTDNAEEVERWGELTGDTNEEVGAASQYRLKQAISFPSLSSTFCIENERKAFENFGQNWRVFAPQFEILDKIGAN